MSKENVSVEVEFDNLINQANEDASEEDQPVSVAKKHKTPRDKFVSKGLRGVLVNLDLALAEEFYRLARSSGSKPTKVARELISRWVTEQQTNE